MRHGVVFAGLALVFAACADEVEEPIAPVALTEIDPFIGTGGLGFGVGSIPPGPKHPYGMANPGPETATRGRAPGFSHCAGYWWEDTEILSFAQMHLAGTGVPDYGALRIMPALDLPDDVVRPVHYRAGLDHGAEQAAVGSYRVRLSPSGIGVDIAATPRTSLYRIAYPEGGRRELVLDLFRGIDQGKTVDADLTVAENGAELFGSMLHDGMITKNGGWRLYFVMKLDVAPERVDWLDADVRSPSSGTLTSSTAGAVLTFADGTEEIAIQIGLSFVDVDTARANLDAEWMDFDLERARLETEAAWSDLLARVRVRGGEKRDREIFFTALYHAQFMPTSFTESGSKYRGIDGEVRTADGFTYYTDFSLWDTFRTLHPLLTLVYPEVQRDMNRSMAEMTMATGEIPKWVLATGETNVMIAYHGESVFVDSYTKGVSGFDAEAIFATLESAAMARADSGRKRDCSPFYVERGWCGADEQSGSVSKTLEAAFGDFVLARFADALGRDGAAFDDRAGNWRNVFDDSISAVRGRNADGSFVEDFTMEAFSEEFVEGNSRQWTVFVPHDPKGLADAMGGDDQFIAFMESFFENAAAEEDTPLPDLWYWHGNEPDIHAPFMFAEVGRPDLTRKWADWVRRTRYTDGPDGLDGNDDGGTLSAWYVFAALGLYPKIAEQRYVLASPVFPEVEIDLEGGTLRVVAKNWAPGRYDVARVTFDGVEIEGPYIDHATIAAGGTLEFEMVE